MARYLPRFHQNKDLNLNRLQMMSLIVVLMLLTACQPVEAVEGSSGIGDSYYPDLGNGGYDVERYVISLQVDPETNFVQGTTTIDAKAEQRLSSFNLDFQGLVVDTVLVNSKAAGFSLEGHELVITPARPLAGNRAFTVLVEYHGNPQPTESVTATSFIPEVGWFHTAQGSINVLNEPNGAETWFPVNDHPRDKAFYQFEITVPKPWVVAASGSLREAKDEGDHTRYVWEMDQPMASYLASVNIDQYTDEQVVLPSGVVFRNYLPPGFPEQRKKVLEKVPAMLDYFSTVFGPYPFREYGVVITSSEITPCQGSRAGALEVQTLSVFCPTGLSLSEAILAHELAHQWFGDSVGIENWQDLWMKEGMATYAEWLWFNRNASPKEFNQFMVGQRDLYIPFAPIGQPPPDDLYGSWTYSGGAMAYHALRVQVGEESFWKIIRTYLERYRHGTASAAEFIALAEEISGQELSAFFDTWLTQTDLPDF